MPVFSEVRVTINQDYTEGGIFRFITSFLNQGGDFWKGGIITTDSPTEYYQQPVPTPTAIAGEATAQAILIALELIKANDGLLYLFSIENNNTLLLQSENAEDKFIGIDVGFNDATIVYNNYVEPVTVDNVPLMLTRSPYYINIPFTESTTTSTTVDLYVWFGDLSNMPSEPIETFTKTRPTIDFLEANVDIAKTVKDQLEPEVPNMVFNQPTQVINNNLTGVQWVMYKAAYNDNSVSIADIEGTLIASEGYGYMIQGVNPSKPNNHILSDVKFRKVHRNSPILLPFVNQGSIESFTIQSNLFSINETIDVTPSENSDQYISYLGVRVSDTIDRFDDNIIITANPSGETFTYQILDECRYTPTDVLFKNKYGVFEVLTMLKKSVESINVEKDDFKNNYINNGTYSFERHQIRDINLVANESIELNSGYKSEEENELFKQLLLSDQVYFYSGEVSTPVTVISSSLEYKTRVNDSLINYKIGFDYAFNVINNI